MKVDASKSEHREADTATSEFDKSELKKGRVLLRRLRFLEAQIVKNGGLANPDASGGAGWAEWEADALEWILNEIGFLAEDTDDTNKEK